MNGKNAKHIRRTHQNRIKIWIRSFQSHRKSFKTGKITQKTFTKLQSTISNAPKCCQNVKNTKKLKRYRSNVPKAAYFSKNHAKSKIVRMKFLWIFTEFIILRIVLKCFERFQESIRFKCNQFSGF